jgi:MFS family permease
MKSSHSRSVLYSHTNSVPPYIYADIGGTDRWIWFVLANLLALAAVCPFVGSLSDLYGRRYVAIAGTALIILGMIICSVAKTMNTFICKYLFDLPCAVTS